MRRLMAGTGWKMNNTIAETLRYGEKFAAWAQTRDLAPVDLFVLPPFTSLHAAATALAGTGVATGGQNMHWLDSGGWTGEISAPMLVEAGCRYVELAHSERLQHFGESYACVRLKVDQAVSAGLIPIICLGETAAEKAAGRADDILREQVLTALAGQPASAIAGVVLAYEPRWAIGGAEAATPAYVAERHAALRELLRQQWGDSAARETRIIYGGSVTPENGRDIIGIDDVDGLFVGRAAWKPEGFARIVEVVAEAAREKSLKAQC